MLETYRKHKAERETQGIPPLPLTAEQTSQLCELLKKTSRRRRRCTTYLAN